MKNHFTKIHFSDKDQELDLQSQVHVEEDEDRVDEEDEDLADSVDKNDEKIEPPVTVIEEKVEKAKIVPASGAQPRLMQKISAKKEVTEETLLAGADIPPFGVKSDYPSELEKVLRMHFFAFPLPSSIELILPFFQSPSEDPPERIHGD